jgi:hypothetical protein
MFTNPDPLGQLARLHHRQVLAKASHGSYDISTAVGVAGHTGREADMAAAVSRERATATWLTGLAGLVILAAAVVMMAGAAPSLAHPRPHGPAAPPASVSTSWLMTRNGPVSGAARVGRAAGQAERDR